MNLAPIYDRYKVKIWKLPGFRPYIYVVSLWIESFIWYVRVTHLFKLTVVYTIIAAVTLLLAIFVIIARH